MKGTLIKILSVLAFAAVVFPFMFGCDINTYGNISVLRMLYYYGIGAVIFFIGFAGAELTRSHRKLRIPARIVGFLMFAAGFLSLLIGGDGVTVFALGVCSVFAFFIGERCGYKNFADMFPLTAFAVYIVLAIGCYIFVRVAAQEEINALASDIVVAAFAIEFAAAALLVNQSGIFDRANMRKETKTSLPKGLTAYNAALVLGFTVTGLVLCVFRKQIAWLIEQCGLILVRALIAFLSLFNAEPMAIEPSEEGAFGGGYALSEESYLLEALGIIVLIVFVVVFRKKILLAIKSFFGRLGSLLSGRLEESEKPEFTDVFENYGVRRSRRELPESIYAIQRRYRSETDPRMKFRYGYRVLLYRIKAVNQRLSPADTTAVQVERGADRFGRAELAAVAHAYDGVRYGDMTPDSAQLSDLHDLAEKP